MILPEIVRDLYWYPEQHRLRGSFLQDLWGPETVLLQDVADAKTRSLLDKFAKTLQMIGRGFAGPFPLRLPKGWLLARWVAVAGRDGSIRVTWLDLAHVPSATTQETGTLRRWQLTQQLERLPVLTQKQREFLEASLRADSDPVPRIKALLQENSLLEFRLLAAINPYLAYGQKPLKTWEQALVRLGATELVRSLQPLVLAQAIPAGSLLEKTVEHSRFLLMSFQKLLPPREAGARLNLRLSAMLFGESLLAHYGHPSKLPLLRQLEAAVLDAASIQEFLYGMHAVDVTDQLLRQWKLICPVSNQERNWLLLALDCLPGLREMSATLSLHAEDWKAHGLVLLQNAEHPIWAQLPFLDKERFQSILDFRFS